jgi:serine/threonine-protein kinase
VAAALIVAAVATLVWVFVPSARPDRQPAAAQPTDGATAGLRPSAVAARPTGEGTVPGLGDQPAPGATDQVRPPAGAPIGGGVVPNGGDANGGAPVVTPGVTEPAGGNGNPDPDPTATPDETEPTTDAPEPQVRTLTSSGGTVRTTCPSPGTAELLSWTATRPYRVEQVSAGPAAAAVVVFKHGNVRSRMTVTCYGGVPSTVNDDG